MKKKEGRWDFSPYERTCVVIHMGTLMGTRILTLVSQDRDSITAATGYNTVDAGEDNSHAVLDIHRRKNKAIKPPNPRALLSQRYETRLSFQSLLPVQHANVRPAMRPSHLSAILPSDPAEIHLMSLT